MFGDESDAENVDREKKTRRVQSRLYPSSRALIKNRDRPSTRRRRRTLAFVVPNEVIDREEEAHEEED